MSVPTVKRQKSKASAGKTVRALLLELPIYGALVVGYFFAVLHFLSDWLQHLHQHQTFAYAIVAIVLVIGQAVVLEWVSTLLLRFFQGGRSE